MSIKSDLKKIKIYNLKDDDIIYLKEKNYQDYSFLFFCRVSAYKQYFYMKNKNIYKPCLASMLILDIRENEICNYNEIENMKEIVKEVKEYFNSNYLDLMYNNISRTKIGIDIDSNWIRHNGNHIFSNLQLQDYFKNKYLFFFTGLYALEDYDKNFNKILYLCNKIKELILLNLKAEPLRKL